MALLKNMIPQSRTYILDALPGVEKPEETRPDGTKVAGGVEYPTITFGARRAKEPWSDTQEVPDGALASSGIKTDLAGGNLIRLS